MNLNNSFLLFRFERFEVLFVFASTVLAQLGAFFIMKERFVLITEEFIIHKQ